MNVLVIENSAGAPAAYLGEHLVTRHGAILTVLRGEDLVDDALACKSDLIVALGSPRGVNDEAAWIAREREIVRRAIDAGVPTIGICFGAQLIASACGGTVAPSGRRYAGWYANDTVPDEVWRGPWLRWHGDAIEPPPGAQTLATADGTVQAFQTGRALGVQFHPEAGPATLEHWISSASGTLRAQLDLPALRAESARRFAGMEVQRAALYDALLARIGSV
jgi:GMP synthase (glutamine-hydrolysing)